MNIKNYFNNLPPQKFKRFIVINGLGCDFLLAITIYHLILAPEFFNHLVEMVLQGFAANGQLIELTTQQKLIVFHKASFQIRALLAIYVGIHSFIYFRFWQNSKMAKNYLCFTFAMTSLAFFSFAYKFLADNSILSLVYLIAGLCLVWNFVGMLILKKRD